MTSYNTVPTVASGDSWSAAQHNTYIRDNFTALAPYTTNGDLAYWSSGSLARIAVGTAGQILQSTGSAPAWVSGDRYLEAGLNQDTALVVGDDAARLIIPDALNGWNLVSVVMARKAGGTGVPAVQVRNVTDGVDMLSTKVTIDSGEVSSTTAAAPPVIDGTKDDVASYDILALDVDVAGTNTLNCVVMLGFRKP